MSFKFTSAFGIQFLGVYFVRNLLFNNLFQRFEITGSEQNAYNYELYS